MVASIGKFLKEHCKTELEATVVRQQKQIDALTAGLRKVSAVELARDCGAAPVGDSRHNHRGDLQASHAGLNVLF